jgi:hypothetical protein
MTQIRQAAMAGLLLAVASSAHAQTLRGSTAAMEQQNRVARAHDFTFLQSGSQIQRFVESGYLVAVRPNADFELGAVSYPYARPALDVFVRRLAAQYRSACGERLVLTSLTRPLNEQPRNASDLSVHPAGMAVDLRIPRTTRCRSWLERTLLSLEGSGVLDAIRERSPAHYHIALFPDQYVNYLTRITDGSVHVIATGSVKESSTPVTADVADAEAEVSGPQAVEYEVRSGDSLWSIARMHGLTVTELRRANGIRGSRIDPGQTLTIPASTSRKISL